MPLCREELPIRRPRSPDECRRQRRIIIFGNIPSDTMVAIGSVVLFIASIIITGVANRLKTDLGDALNMLKTLMSGHI